jgi:hypothetical protein
MTEYYFYKGDIVRLKKQGQYGEFWNGELTITEDFITSDYEASRKDVYSLTNLTWVKVKSKGFNDGAFYPYELEIVTPAVTNRARREAVRTVKASPSPAPKKQYKVLIPLYDTFDTFEEAQKYAASTNNYVVACTDDIYVSTTTVNVTWKKGY